MADSSTVASVASIVSGFGVAVFLFRLQRELQIAEDNLKRPEKKREPNWIPLADWLVFVAVVVALMFGVLPLLGQQQQQPPLETLRAASGACAASVVLLAGYLPAILGHYNFIYWLKEGRKNPTVPELIFVILTAVGAYAAYRVVA
jgi:hypothetical protein